MDTTADAAKNETTQRTLDGRTVRPNQFDGKAPGELFSGLAYFLWLHGEQCPNAELETVGARVRRLKAEGVL